MFIYILSRLYPVCCLVCPGAQTYQNPVSTPCPVTCANKQGASSGCYEPGVPGCRCPPGAILADGDMCLDPINCKCPHDDGGTAFVSFCNQLLF